MATTKDTETSAGRMDTVLLALAALVVAASLVAYYYFEGVPVVVRALGILAGLGIGAALFYRTQQGQVLWQFMQTSRVEIRKVVWPSRDETMKGTLAVFAFIFALGAFFWVLDLFLLYVTRMITGQGS